MTPTIYQELTMAFNAGRLRAILSSGQAVVMHRLAVMSKDGDWILREDAEALGHVRKALAERGGHYRFGAPLDARWLAGGWSSHFEFRAEPLRVRTDFVTRPPRITPQALEKVWKDAEAAGARIPFADAVTLAELKKTNRERDYAVIGELARLIKDPMDCLLLSRSARDLVALARQYPGHAEEAAAQRPLLKLIHEGRDCVEAALDAERRELIRANEQRLRRYMDAAGAWAAAWPEISAEISGLPLEDAHTRLVAHAETLLPFEVDGL